MKLHLSALVLGVITSLAGTDAFGQYVKPQPAARDVSRKVSLRCSPRRLWFDFSGKYGKYRVARQVAAGISGYEGALPDTYGMKPERLAELLNEWKARR